MVQFVTLPQQGGDQRQVAEVVRGIMDGKTNNTGSITLATGGATSTTLYNERIGYDSIVLLSPTTTNAAGFSYYIDSNAQGSVVIRHAANSTALRTFKYIIVG
jgi:hypothetical protein